MSNILNLLNNHFHFFIFSYYNNIYTLNIKTYIQFTATQTYTLLKQCRLLRGKFKISTKDSHCTFNLKVEVDLGKSCIYSCWSWNCFNPISCYSFFFNFLICSRSNCFWLFVFLQYWGKSTESAVGTNL